MGDISLTQVLETLGKAFPHTVLRPGSPRYEEENGKFWNRDNADVRPAGIVAPESAAETGAILKVLSDTKTHFAIRSGGYMPVPKYNTSPAVLISLSRLSSIELLPPTSPSPPLVKFGAGNTWGPIYDVLSPHGLVVPGGRSRDVGVGGFLLHGGVSHFYASLGWACESVVEFDVALASGDVVAANASLNADLFWALKGGSANFGVVTAFTMRTAKLEKMWGGVRVAVGTGETASRVFTALHAGIQGDVDEKAHVEVISFYNPTACAGGDALFVLSLAYAGEVEKEGPAALKGFMEVEAVNDGTRVTTQRELAADDKVNVGYDKRGLFRAFSYRGGPQVTLDIYTEYYALVKASGVFDADPSAMAALLWLPVGQKLASGTGVMTLGEDAEPYLSCNICIRWSSPSVSERIHAIADGIADTLKKKLQDAGVFVPFTYGNIAGVQDMTFAGLPETTRRRLREVAGRYDPEGVFQKQVPGFKLV
ncbi:FAD-binding domain-containing protein [Karstenula rhodostoma CBS 690.94]|uniref:FAD-binding domain-containing protein n=1 Tax=Karstenula rhodostoma CBS 690.94 TaxID=1392251 RepID=A0A9P4UCC7_9PLEO|nr:FAD-binding domain-containing protein [Karstenula rhodostoma CBS 690.94]